ncbi:hypothetical protein MRX96_039882 [Rhipicephalus microplus]
MPYRITVNDTPFPTTTPAGLVNYRRPERRYATITGQPGPLGVRWKSIKELITQASLKIGIVFMINTDYRHTYSNQEILWTVDVLGINIVE